MVEEEEDTIVVARMASLRSQIDILVVISAHVGSITQCYYSIFCWWGWWLDPDEDDRMGKLN